MNKTCIIIAGATATGKTNVALQLARQLKTSIISADSRQCFKELNIGVAKPSPAELKNIPHYFINSHSVSDTVSAATFENYALEKAALVFKEKDVIIMAGGTGLYIRAFCEGMDPIPETDPELRDEIIKNYTLHGLAWLQQEVKAIDPAFFSQGEISNPQRLMRALEVARSTGRSVTDFRSGKVKQREFNIIKTALDIPRDTLYDRINTRVDEMIQYGLVDEARNLYKYKNMNALNTVGYKELFSHFDGDITMEDAIRLIKQNTRNYAKRQITWFKKDPSIKWIKTGEDPVAAILKLYDN